MRKQVTKKDFFMNLKRSEFIQHHGDQNEGPRFSAILFIQNHKEPNVCKQKNHSCQGQLSCWSFKTWNCYQGEKSSSLGISCGSCSTSEGDWSDMLNQRNGKLSGMVLLFHWAFSSRRETHGVLWKFDLPSCHPHQPYQSGDTAHNYITLALRWHNVVWRNKKELNILPKHPQALRRKDEDKHILSHPDLLVWY